MKLYNSLTKVVEEFVPIRDNKVNFFVCGPTVYDFAHIGNGRTAITMDVLVRTLKYLGYEVNFLVNITDIDDKIIKKATSENTDWQTVSQKYETQYKKDMSELDIIPTQYARATDYIDQIKTQVQRLIDKGSAYKIDDGIYFEITTFSEYGKLSGRSNIEKDDAESRIDQNDNKRGWNDFCLWKFSKENEPSWPADFGEGRPGWHIEDTAITEHLFGPQYDIHGGGTDLIFPHHEAEITQMEAISGKVPFVKYWVHGGLLYINDQRMGKSNKNFYTINELTQKYNRNVIRLFMLQGHYRSVLNFSFELLDACHSRYLRWLRIADLRHQIDADATDVSNELEIRFKHFVECLENDLDTPSAIAEVEKIMTLIEKLGINQNSKTSFEKILDTISQTFGVNLLYDEISHEIKDLIKQRDTAKQQKNWKDADKIRDILKAKGIALMDIEGREAYWSRSSLDES